MMKLIDQKVKYVRGSVVPLEDGEAIATIRCVQLGERSMRMIIALR